MPIANNVSFVRGHPVPITTADIAYEVPAGIDRAVFNHAILHNYDTVSVDVELWQVQDGIAGISNTTRILNNKTLSPNETYSVSELVGNVLRYNAVAGKGAIYTEASVADAVSLTLSGSTATNVNSTGIAYGRILTNAIALGASVSQVYAVGTSLSRAEITKSLVLNQSGVASDLNLWITSGDTQPDEELVINQSIPANSSVILNAIHGANVNYKIYASGLSLVLFNFGTEYAV